jgi:hypothetical protein
MNISEHKVGDLVFSQDVLGYISEVIKYHNGPTRYVVEWTDNGLEFEYSHTSITKMKRRAEEEYAYATQSR